MREKLLYLAAGILSAVAIQAPSSVFIDPNGVEYPDGTYQTTAADGYVGSANGAVGGPGR